MKKGDIYAGAVIGVLIAIFVPVIARNIDIRIPYEFALVIVLPIATIVGLYVAYWLSRFVPVLYQIAKFGLIGVLNTAVDFAVANFLIFVTGIAMGAEVSFFKGIAFTVAVINSYFWNKFWTFRQLHLQSAQAQAPRVSARKGGAGEFAEFIIVSVIGLGINVGAASLVINGINAPAGLSPERWANIGFLVATFAALTWNFLGYKFIVFKKR